MEQRLKKLETALDFVTASHDNAWLYANRVERMDANVTFFDLERRRFHRARYEFATAFVTGRSVADIASGTGYGAEILKQQGAAASVIGVDIDAQAVQYAERKYGAEGIRFLCASGDATRIPEGTLDVITSFETIEHVPDDQILLREFARVLKRDGRLIVSTPNGWPLRIAPFHVREYDFESFTRALSPHFVVKEMFNQNSGTNWEFNRGQPAGIVRTTAHNHSVAECLIAVCEKRA